MRHVYVEFATKPWASRILDATGGLIPHIQRAVLMLALHEESTVRLWFVDGHTEDCTWSPYRVVDLTGQPVTDWGTLTNRPRLMPPLNDPAGFVIPEYRPPATDDE